MLLQDVVVLAADEKYLPHVKSVLVNCRRQGEWKSDCCLILPPDVDTEYFTSRGIYVLTDPAPTYFRKYALFDQYFNQQYMNPRGNPEYKWDRVLYLDADVLVQNPLASLMHEVGWGTILADRELWTLHHAFTHWATTSQNTPEATKAFDWLWENYSSEWRQYNTGVMLYHPRTLPTDARKQLTAMHERIAPINTHVGKGTDQPVINLMFYKLFERVRSDLFCYYRSAWEKTIVIHYCSGLAPWIDKRPGMAAHFNHTLGRPCHDVYLENLAAFEETFPVKT